MATRQLTRGLILCGLLGLIAGPGPALLPEKQPSQYLHEVWDEMDGLPDPAVHAILQTSDGYLWLATGRGPVRFDGMRFEEAHFSAAATVGGASSALLEDRQGYLWSAGTTSLRRLRQGSFPETFQPYLEVQGATITSLLEDAGGRVWVGTGEGLYRLRGGAPDGNQRGFEAMQSLAGHSVRALLGGFEGGVWVGTDQGLYHLRDETVSRYATAEGLPSDEVLALHGSDEGMLWVGTAAGVAAFDQGRFTPYPGPPELETQRVHSLRRDRHDNLWAGTETHLLRWKEVSAGLPRPAQSLELGHVHSLLEDREGSLWIGTGQGLHRLEDGGFTPFTATEGLAENSVRTVSQDAYGSYWIGTESGILHQMRDGRILGFDLQIGTPGNPILSVHRDRYDTLWVGTGSGLWYLSANQPGQPEAREGLGSDIVTVITGDERGDLWIGTAGGGLHRLRNGTRQSYTTEDGLANNFVRCLLRDRQGDLWIGTEDGLDRLRAGRFEPFSVDDGLASNFILSLHEDEAGRLWVGTDTGLSQLREDGFVSFDSRVGLYNEMLYQLQSDGRGFLWACSNKGLFRLRTAELAEFAAGRRSRIRSLPLDGTSGMECNGFNQPASLRDREGRLWFATVEGLLRVDPSELEHNPLPPPVVLEAVRLDGQPVDPHRALAPMLGAHSLEFEYTALSLSSPRRIRFRRKLEKYDREWIENDRRLATYTNLPPGKYRFRVEASHGDGVWSRQGIDFPFEVAPPMHRTPAFYALASVSALLFVALLYRFRLQQLVRRNRQLGESVARRTAEVQLQKEALARANARLSKANRQLRPANAELKNLNREKADFLAIAAHDLRAPLVNLKGFTGELRSSFTVLQQVAQRLEASLNDEQRRALHYALNEDVPEALEFIDASTDRMNQLVTALLALSQLGRQRLEVETVDMDLLVQESLDNLRYTLDQKGIEVQVQPLAPINADRAAVKQILDNLLHNAVSYLDPQRPGRIEVGCQPGTRENVYFVRDNGSGIAEEQKERVFKLLDRAGRKDVPGEGMGLAFVRSLIERHGGRIWFDSEVGAGTTFRFSLPHRSRGDSGEADL